MSSHTDELEKELRQNLKLRRELGVNAAKATAAIALEQRNRFAYRLGRFLYWAFLVLAVTWAGFVAFLASGEDDLSRHWLFYLLVFSIPMLLLYGVGRALRFILSEG
jgi:hypothetical protein